MELKQKTGHKTCQTNFVLKCWILKAHSIQDRIVCRCTGYWSSPIMEIFCYLSVIIWFFCPWLLLCAIYLFKVKFESCDSTRCIIQFIWCSFSWRCAFSSISVKTQTERCLRGCNRRNFYLVTNFLKLEMIGCKDFFIRSSFANFFEFWRQILRTNKQRKKF